MNTYLLRIASFATICVFLFSCSPRYYVPTTQNVPVIYEQGQTNITAAGNENLIEIQGAYGLTPSMAIQAGGGFVMPKDEDNGNGGSGKFADVGVGYYKNISPAILFDTYILAGGGIMENHFPTSVTDNPQTTGKISANIVRFGIQPSISAHNQYLSFTGSARLMNVNYTNISGGLIFNGENQQDYLSSNRSNFMLEPALTLRAGIENIKFQLQVVKSFNLSNSDFLQEDMLVSLGLNLTF